MGQFEIEEYHKRLYFLFLILKEYYRNSPEKELNDMNGMLMCY